jgi:succinate dehydrogenase / fumarate reductase, flavoprotein subunit
MEVTVVALLKDGGASRARSPTSASAAASRCSARRAVVLATGGIGRAYRITSNSWEYTGDGHALAYDAGAELIDMEFVQFHPTGMVWPPSVRASSSPKACAARAACCEEQRGRRFMFDDIPDNYEPRPPTRPTRAGATRRATRTRGGRPSCSRATTWRAASSARSRRGAAARTAACSSTSPGSRSTSERAEEHIRRSCRACTTSSRSWRASTSPGRRWRSGPTTHYVMGGVRVDADTQMSTCRPLRRRRVRGGLHGANRLGGNSLSDLLVFGKRAGEYAARSPASRTGRRIDERQVDAPRSGAGALRARRRRERAVQIQHELQEMMQDLVGIVRRRQEMQQALEGDRGLGAAAPWRSPATASTTPAGTRRSTSTTCSPCPRRSRGGARAQGEPRRALPRGLPGEGPGVYATSYNRIVVRRDGADGEHGRCRGADSSRCR